MFIDTNLRRSVSRSSPPTFATTTASTSGHTIDARSIVTLIVFLLVNAVVIWPIGYKLSIPVPSSWADPVEPIEVWTEDLGPAPPSADTVNIKEQVGDLSTGAKTEQGQDKAEAEQPEQPIQPDETDTKKEEAASHSTPAAVDTGGPTREETVDFSSATEVPPEPNTPHSTIPTTTAPRDSEPSSTLNPPNQPHQVTSPRLPITLTLDLATAPVVGVLLLLASTCIPPSVVRSGIVGSGGVRPYDIMTLFLSFAYISLSLDRTGLFRYLAALVASRTSSSGRTLYLALYLFFVISGLIIGNDPIVLSGTPFLAYFTRHARISPPTAFIFTQFQAANLVSALLVSSNPTNLVLTSAFNISFLSYSAWTALPTIASTAVLYPLLRWGVFRSEEMIPHKIEKDDTGGGDGGSDPRTALTDAVGGVFGAALFIVTIVALVGLSAGSKLEGVEGVWTVTAPAAIVMLLRDCSRDLWVAGASKASSRQVQGAGAEQNGGEVDRARESFNTDVTVEQGFVDGTSIELKPVSGQLGSGAQEGKRDTPSTSAAGVRSLRQRRTNPSLRSPSPTPILPPPLTFSTPNEDELTTSDLAPPISATQADHTSPSSPSGAVCSPLPSSSPPARPRAHIPRPHFLTTLSETFPTATSVVARLPLPLVPFAFSMFILVEGLQETGWVEVFGRWWTAWARVGGTAGCIWLMGVIGVLGCNVLGTNIGATVLLSRVMQAWQASTDVSKRSLYGSVFALAIGSNFGAYSFVFSASLAGLLWRDILTQKGLHVSVVEFARYNIVPLVVTMIVGCLIVAAEVCVIY